MPNFRYLKDEEANALVSYVMHLAVRGSAEFEAIVQTLNGEPHNEPSAGFDEASSKIVIDELNAGLRYWQSEAKPIKVEPCPEGLDNPQGVKFAESVRAGYQLFIGKGGCVKCHVDFGRQSTFRYDIWGTLVKPNNLTQGVYRGGRRPVDIYYRIAGGIDPSTMPAVDAEILKDPNSMWSLVNFVRTLPYARMLPDDVRAKVYGPSGRN